MRVNHATVPIARTPAAVMGTAMLVTRFGVRAFDFLLPAFSLFRDRLTFDRVMILVLLVFAGRNLSLVRFFS